MAADRPPNKVRGAPERGEFDVVNPTVRHAAMLFDLVANLLGGAIRFPFLRAGTGCA